MSKRQYVKKTISFDTSDAEQVKSFEFLENIRYYQSRFIAKLISDYRKEHNISDSSTYEEIKNDIYNYIGIKGAGYYVQPQTPDEKVEEIANMVVQKLMNIGYMPTQAVSTRKEISQPVDEEKTSSPVEEPEDDGLTDMLAGFADMMNS